MKITIPNLITISRIILTPIIVYCMLQNWWNSACVFFIIAACTDILDGFLARYLNQKTFLGACLDPIADKILMISLFFALFIINSAVFYVPFWFISCMIAKELMQILGALVLYVKKGFVPIEARVWGKVAMLMYISFVGWLFYCHFINYVPGPFLYHSFLISMTMCMGISFVQYGYMWLIRLQK